MGNLRTINTAQVTYMSGAQGSYGGLSDLVTAGLLDTRFNSAVSGDSYTVTTASSNTDYTAIATPTSANTGRFGYYSGPDGVVRYSSGSGVTAGAPVQ